MISMCHNTDQNRPYQNSQTVPGRKHHQTSDSSPHVRRDHKDRLFCDLFSDKQNALSLFNAVNGTNYSDVDALEIITLKNVVYLTMHNDLAVCIYGQMGLFEQQSTINPNMPLRGYTTLITLIRREQAAGKEITEAAAAAIDTCIEKNILRDYLIKHKAEVTGMILTEYNEKLHEKTLRQEGREEGMEEGLIKGRREGREEEQEKMAEAVRSLMGNLNLSAEEAMKLLGLSEEDRERYMALL